MSRVRVLSGMKACGLLLTTLAGCATTGGPAGQSWSHPASKPVAVVPGDNGPCLARVGGCQIVHRHGQMRLLAPTEGRSLVQTMEEYRPPFALRVRAKTDSTNVRLYYNAGMVILNWEVRPSELRFHDPVNDRVSAFPGKGAIEVGKCYDICWEIYPDGTRLLVNGKEVMRKSAEYGNLRAPVGIGPAFGSVLTVESFHVEPLQGTLDGTQ